MKGYRKILIAVKGSQEVLRQGLRVAREEGCWVTVLKVIPPYEGDLSLVGISNISDLLDSGAQEAVSGIKETAVSEGALIKTRLEEGAVDEKIVEAAEEERCDLIIMGAHRRSWLKRLFGRSVVEKVVDHAPCPVLVVGAR